MSVKDSKCLRCGHEWRSRIDQPRECPKCRRRTWTSPINNEVVQPKPTIKKPHTNIGKVNF